MTTIPEIYRAAFEVLTSDQWGIQTKLSKKTGFSTGKINNLARGERHGSEDDRRLIAAALGFPGVKYEAFLDLGRRELGLPTLATREKPPAPDVAAYLDKARTALEGPNAGLVKDLLNLLAPTDRV